MATLPETRFYRKIHKHLDKAIHKEKMANPYRGGTPDVWYSGLKTDLWIEYKWLSKPALKAPIYVHKLLSALQTRWLDQRLSEGRNVAVILGTPVGAWIYEDGTWGYSRQLPTSITQDKIIRKGLTHVGIAEFINQYVGGRQT